MQVSKVRGVFFSPHGNTKTVTMHIANALGQLLHVPVSEDDFTTPPLREEKRTFDEETLVVFGMPTYAGRVPNKALPFVQSLFTGQKTPLVAVTTFGNRSFDESAKELSLTLAAQGFAVCAAAGIACSHAFAPSLGAGRPEEADFKRMDEFAKGVCAVLADASSADALSCPFPLDAEVGPYYTPLEADGTPASFLKAKPVTDLTRCDNCGICVTRCPFGSIDASDVTRTPGICVKCHACVTHCPAKAKHFEDRSLASHITYLEEHYTRRAESEFFLPGVFMKTRSGEAE